MAKLKELRAAAQNMIDVMTLVPDPEKPKQKYDLSTYSAEDLEDFIKEAIIQIQEDDVFEDDTNDIIATFKAPAEEVIKPARTVAEPKVAKQEADIPPVIDTVPLEDDLANDIKDAEKLSDLKEIAKEETIFKPIRGKLSSYKTVDELRKVMLDMINPPKKVVKPVPPPPVKEKSVKEKKKKGPGRAEVFTEIYNEGKALTMKEWEEQMHKRYTKSDSPINAKIFTGVYTKLLLTLGFMVEKNGKLIPGTK